MLPAWWYTIFYLYSAATVLVAAQLSPDILTSISEDTIIGAWHKVLKMFKILSSFSNHATRCAAALKTLFDQVTEQRSGGDQFQHQKRSDERPMPPLQHQQQGWRLDRARNPQYFPNEFGTTATIDSWSATIPRSANPNEATTILPPDENTVTMEHPAFQSVINFASSLDLLDLPDIQVDLNRMSWLTSFPTEF